MRCVLIGNYGVANLGDEALREYFLHTFSDIEWTVLSANPRISNEIPRLPGGIRSFFTTKWWKALKAIRQSDAVVFGGGTLFTDIESVYACFLWSMHAWIARLNKKPVILAFQGIGPFKTEVGERLARTTARHSAFFSVRDTASFERVKIWGLSINVVQTFDPVFSFINKQKIDYSTKKVFTIIPRHNSGNSLISEAQKILSENTFDSLSILLLQPHHEGEQLIARALEQQLKLPATVTPVLTLSDLIKGVGQSSMVLSQRYHGGIAAVALGVPLKIVHQEKGDKLSELLNQPAGELSQRIEIGEKALRECLSNISSFR